MNTLKYKSVRKISDYRHTYQGQFQPQDAYFELLEGENEVYATWNGEIGNAVPFSVFHGRDRRYHFSPMLKVKEVNALGRQILPLLEIVRAGMSIEWDGNNYKGVLNESAQSAEWGIELLIHEAECMACQYR